MILNGTGSRGTWQQDATAMFFLFLSWMESDLFGWPCGYWLVAAKYRFNRSIEFFWCTFQYVPIIKTNGMRLFLQHQFLCPTVAPVWPSSLVQGTNSISINEYTRLRPYMGLDLEAWLDGLNSSQESKVLRYLKLARGASQGGRSE